MIILPAFIQEYHSTIRCIIDNTTFVIPGHKQVPSHVTSNYHAT